MLAWNQGIGEEASASAALIGGSDHALHTVFPAVCARSDELLGWDDLGFYRFLVDPTIKQTRFQPGPYPHSMLDYCRNKRLQLRPGP